MGQESWPFLTLAIYPVHTQKKFDQPLKLRHNETILLRIMTPTIQIDDIQTTLTTPPVAQNINLDATQQQNQRPITSKREAEEAKRKEDLILTAKSLNIELGDAEAYSADEIEIEIVKEMERRRKLAARTAKLEASIIDINNRFKGENEIEPAIVTTSVYDMATLIATSRERIQETAPQKQQEAAKVHELQNEKTAVAEVPFTALNRQKTIQEKLDTITCTYMKAAAERILFQEANAEVATTQESTARVIEIDGREAAVNTAKSVTRVNGQVIGEQTNSVEMIFTADAVDHEVGNARLTHQEGSAQFSGVSYNVLAIGTAINSFNGQNVSIRSAETFTTYSEAYQWGMANAADNAEKAMTQLMSGHTSTTSEETSLPDAAYAGMADAGRAA